MNRHAPPDGEASIPDEQPTVNTWDSVAGEDVNVPGHRFDVDDRHLPLQLDDGRVLLRSDMRTDPVEGTQGSYTVADPDEDCPDCGLPGLHTTVITLAGEAMTSCPHCDWDEYR